VTIKFTNKDIIEWLRESFTKITLGINSEEELLNLYKILELLNIPISLIQDAGHTEFHGIPTYTGIGIGPVNSDVIDKFTGNLKLL
jgi:PTH2 family peptidyl-tRNA hydrolase